MMISILEASDTGLLDDLVQYCNTAPTNTTATELDSDMKQHTHTCTYTQQRNHTCLSDI